MSNLNKKIEEIVYQLDKGSVFGDYFDTDGVPKVIAQIKQAFKDEGYINTGISSDVKHVTGLMTSQEWYEKFKVEITKDLKALDDETLSIALKAARRASGLEE